MYNYRHTCTHQCTCTHMSYISCMIVFAVALQHLEKHLPHSFGSRSGQTHKLEQYAQMINIEDIHLL